MPRPEPAPASLALSSSVEACEACEAWKAWDEWQARLEARRRDFLLVQNFSGSRPPPPPPPPPSSSSSSPSRARRAAENDKAEARGEPRVASWYTHDPHTAWFWGGAGSSSYPLHRDLCDADAFFTVLSGCKEFVVLGPEQRTVLHRVDVAPDLAIFSDDVWDNQFAFGIGGLLLHRAWVHFNRVFPTLSSSMLERILPSNFLSVGRSLGSKFNRAPAAAGGGRVPLGVDRKRAWRGALLPGETLFMPGEMIHSVRNPCPSSVSICRRLWRSSGVRDIEADMKELIRESSMEGITQRNFLVRLYLRYLAATAVAPR